MIEAGEFGLEEEGQALGAILLYQCLCMTQAPTRGWFSWEQSSPQHKSFDPILFKFVPYSRIGKRPPQHFFTHRVKNGFHSHNIEFFVVHTTSPTSNDAIGV